jgi:hypothetical protein
MRVWLALPVFALAAFQAVIAAAQSTPAYYCVVIECAEMPAPIATAASMTAVCALAMSLVCLPMTPAPPWNGRLSGRSRTGTMIRSARMPM